MIDDVRLDDDGLLHVLPLAVHKILSVSPSPLGTNWVFELIRTWLWLGLKVWGQGLTIKLLLILSPSF